MPRREQPDLTLLDSAPRDAAERGARVVSPQDVAEVVRWARTQKLGTQQQAVDRLGVSLTMLGALERGEGGSQLDLTLGVLADLGLDVVLVPRDPTVSLRSAPQ